MEPVSCSLKLAPAGKEERKRKKWRCPGESRKTAPTSLCPHREPQQASAPQTDAVKLADETFSSKAWVFAKGCFCPGPGQVSLHLSALNPSGGHNPMGLVSPAGLKARCFGSSVLWCWSYKLGHHLGGASPLLHRVLSFFPIVSGCARARVYGVIVSALLPTSVGFPSWVPDVKRLLCLVFRFLQRKLLHM